jgi:hypothetical protein
LGDQILGTGDSANEAAKIAGNQLTRNRLQALFPSSDAYNSFMGDVNAEKAAFGTRYATGLNSATAERAAADSAAGAHGGSPSSSWPTIVGMTMLEPHAGMAAAATKLGAQYLLPPLWETRHKRRQPQLRCSQAQIRR